MANFIGNYNDFLKVEMIRLRKTEEPTVREELIRLANVNSSRTNDRKSKIIISK